MALLCFDWCSTTVLKRGASPLSPISSVSSPIFVPLLLRLIIMKANLWLLAAINRRRRRRRVSEGEMLSREPIGPPMMTMMMIGSSLTHSHSSMSVEFCRRDFPGAANLWSFFAAAAAFCSCIVCLWEKRGRRMEQSTFFCWCHLWGAWKHTQSHKLIVGWFMRSQIGISVAPIEY